MGKAPGMKEEGHSPVALAAAAPTASVCQRTATQSLLLFRVFRGLSSLVNAGGKKKPVRLFFNVDKRDIFINWMLLLLRG